ncbi:hypothetical protein AB0O95_06975 [Rhodoglobus sp. NPDC076762]
MDVVKPGVKAAFLKRLAKATEDGAVGWSVSDSREFWYWLHVGPFAYVIESADSDDAPPYDFHIFKISEEVEPYQKLETWRWDREGSALNPFFSELYSAARAQALGMTNFSNELFSTLAAVDGGPADVQDIELPSSDIGGWEF